MTVVDALNIFKDLVRALRQISRKEVIGGISRINCLDAVL